MCQMVTQLWQNTVISKIAVFSLGNFKGAHLI